MNWRHFIRIQRDGHSVYLVLLCNYHLKTQALYRRKSSPCFRIRNTSARRTSLVPREKERKRRGVTMPSTPTRYLAGRPHDGDHDQVVAGDRPTANTMTLEIGNRVVATARFSEHAAVDGNGAWTSRFIL